MIPTKWFDWINEFDGQIDHEIQICDWVFLYTSKKQVVCNMVFLYNPVYGSDIPYIQLKKILYNLVVGDAVLR